MELPFVQIEGHMMISKSSNAQLSDTMDLSPSWETKIHMVDWSSFQWIMLCILYNNISLGSKYTVYIRITSIIYNFTTNVYMCNDAQLLFVCFLDMRVLILSL